MYVPCKSVYVLAGLVVCGYRAPSGQKKPNIKKIPPRKEKVEKQ